VRAYPELLAIAWGAIAEGGCDFLGSVASQMEVLSTQIGQFFTPYEVSRMIAAMTLQDVGPLIEANGFVTISEPASGAGGMILAAADTLHSHGFDPSLHMLVNAVDLSSLCYHMTFLQLTLRGIPALVEQANSLSLERFEQAWTPATLPFYARHGKLFPAQELRNIEPPKPRMEPTPISGDRRQFDLFDPAA
jgi:N-6 DNA Methylase